jgi:phage gpG-like protein
MLSDGFLSRDFLPGVAKFVRSQHWVEYCPDSWHCQIVLTSLNITYEIKGFDQAVWKLNNVRQTLMWKAIGGEIVDMTHENMGADGGPRPAPWSALSPNYAKRVTPPVPTLLRTGRLKNSIGHGPAGQNGTVVFSDCEYAAVHQFGSSSQLNLFSKARIPARPYFPIQSAGAETQLTPYALHRLSNVVAQELAKAFRGL